MQRFINNPDFIVEDMVEGFVKAHEDIVCSSANPHVVKYRASPKGKVGLVSGGGSGHEPAFLGYVGKHMLDAVAVGEVFSSPPAQAFYDAFIEADQGAGVACLYGNYAGDNMNVQMAIQMAEEAGVSVACVIANDDIASAPKEEKEKRHGIAGGVFMWKVAGAKAAMGGSLEEVVNTAQKAVDHTRSICVGLSSCTIPAVGTSNFTIEDGTMEFGIGHHGEPGTSVEPIKTAKEIAEKMCTALLEDLEIEARDDLAIIVSGLGATPQMELYVLYDSIEAVLREKGQNIHKVCIGNYVTSLDMNGVALTIMKLDRELITLLDFPANCPGIVVT